MVFFRIMALCFGVWFGLQAQEVESEQTEDHRIGVEDYFSLGTLTDLAVSPRGDLVVYGETRWEGERDVRNRDLWVLDASNRSTERLTFDPADDHDPQWSPDGRSIFFLSDRKEAGETEPPSDGSTQVWRVSAAGGLPFPVTRVAGGIHSFDLSEDGKTLYFTTHMPGDTDPWGELKDTYDQLEYGHDGGEQSRLWALDLASWKTTELLTLPRTIKTFSISEDGARVAMITTPDRQLISHEGWSSVEVATIETGSVSLVTPQGWRKQHPSPFGWLQGVSWSHDGQALAFSISFDGYPTELYVAFWQGDGWRLQMIRRDDAVDVADGARLIWRGTTRDLCFLGSQKARKRVCAVPNISPQKHARIQALTEGDVVIENFDFDADGSQLVVALSDVTHPADLYLVETPSHYRQLTQLNPQVNQWKLPKIEEVQWNSTDGVAVHGILELPPDYDGKTRLPLIVELHGGPTAATYLHFRFWIYGRTLMAAQGYALLSPNYRGSIGYGSKFMTDLVGHENEVEVADIMTGIDAMIARGFVDPDRIGVMGWSNGGYLTNCVITHSDRFKAASSGAGILSMLLQWSAEDTPGHVVNFMQGLPWEKSEAYTHASPVYRLDRIRTPTLIHVGGDDARCPPVHSKGLYRALRHYLHIPTELVVYPGEGHTLTTYAHRKAKMDWDLAWFAHYLLETEGNQAPTGP